MLHSTIEDSASHIAKASDAFAQLHVGIGCRVHSRIDWRGNDYINCSTHLDHELRFYIRSSITMPFLPSTIHDTTSHNAKASDVFAQIHVGIGCRVHVRIDWRGTIYINCSTHFDH